MHAFISNGKVCEIAFEKDGIGAVTHFNDLIQVPKCIRNHLWTSKNDPVARTNVRSFISKQQTTR